jgi:hypothetical protein
VRRSRSSVMAVSCTSSTEAFGSRPMPAATSRPRRALRSVAGSSAVHVERRRRAHRHHRRRSPARSTRPATCPSPARTTGSVAPTGAARSRSPSSPTPSRSASVKNSSGCTRSATTAPASTAPSPTPAVDPAGSTPHEPQPPRHTTTGATTSHGYRALTIASPLWPGRSTAPNCGQPSGPIS